MRPTVVFRHQLNPEHDETARNLAVLPHRPAHQQQQHRVVIETHLQQTHTSTRPVMYYLQLNLYLSVL